MRSKRWIEISLALAMAGRMTAVWAQERLEKQVVQGRKALADFEEETRRAGVPPGWLR